MYNLIYYHKSINKPYEFSNFKNPNINVKLSIWIKIIYNVIINIFLTF